MQPAISRTDDERATTTYTSFMRSRWPQRTRLLAFHAFAGSLAFSVLDWFFTRFAPSPPSLATIASLRLPWIVLPLAGWIVQKNSPQWGGLPACTIVLSVLWTWGNEYAFFALGMGGSPFQALAAVGCIVTVATFMPLTLTGRASVFALMALGHVALDVLWPQGPPVPLRLLTDVTVLALVVAVTVTFENLAASQRRAFRLRSGLEATVAQLEESRLRAADAAAAVVLLAQDVAHKVNNPLAVVKSNLRWLSENCSSEPHGSERSEVFADTLEAVQRIASTVNQLGRDAGSYDVPTPDASER